MAESALATTVILAADNIRGCLQRAEKAEDVTKIRGILAKIEPIVDQLVASAKAEVPEGE